MKSLKRTLSLVLALVMVLGLFGGLSINAAATDFTDDEKIQYNEAVDVMTAIGAIDGYKENGQFSFKPEATITRAEAAKLVAYTILGPKTAKGLSSSSTKFNDVPASKYDWAIPSIAYLTEKGVINGVGGNSFDPEGNITGYEIAKMLLCAVGWGQNGEYTGSGWDLKVSIDASQKGVFDGRASDATDPGKAATREECALYCFNAIQMDMVEYLSTLGIYNPVSTTGLGTGTTIATIRKTIYPALDDKNDYNALGQPSTVWSYGKDEIGRYADSPELTYTAKVKKTTVTGDFKTLTLASNTFKKENYVTNNKPEASDITGADVATTMGNIADKIVASSSNGTRVEVYINTDRQITDVVVIKTELAQVTGVDDASGAVQLTSRAASGGLNNGNPYTVKKTDDLYSVVSGLKKDDRILIVPLYTTSYNALASASVPETKTGIYTTDLQTTGQRVISGTTYSMAAGANASAETTTDAKKEINFWLDNYGYIADMQYPNEASSSIMYYCLSTAKTLVDGKLIQVVTMVGTNGETVDLYTTEGATVTPGTVYRVGDPDKDGVYTMLGLTGTKADKVSGLDGSGSAVTAPTNAATSPELEKDNVVKLENNNGSAHASIGKSNKKLSDATIGLDSSTDKKYGNWFADDVKFIYVKSNTKGGYDVVSVLTGVQNVTTAGQTDAADNCLAITEEVKMADGTAKPVVTAVICPNKAIEGVDADTSKIVFIDDIIDTISMVGKDGKSHAVTYYLTHTGSEASRKAITNSTTLTKGSFYYLAEDRNIDGAYAASSVTNSGSTSQILKDLLVTSGADNYITFVTANTTILQITDKTLIVDTRTEDAQAQYPITKTGAGLNTAATKWPNGVEVSVVYDATTNNASLVYISSCMGKRAALNFTGNGSTANNTSGVSTTTITSDPATSALVAVDDLVKVTIEKTAVSGGTDVEMKVTFSAVNGLEVVASSLTGTGATWDNAGNKIVLPAAMAVNAKVTIQFKVTSVDSAPTLTATAASN